MKTPTYLYHESKGAQLFDADVVDIDGMIEQGWSDEPFSVTEDDIQPVASEDETIQAQVNELVQKEQALAIERDEFEADKRAFMSLIDKSKDKIAPAIDTLSVSFADDPKSLTVKDLYAYGKAIGAKVHYRHLEDKLISVIQEHLDGNA